MARLLKLEERFRTSWVPFQSWKVYSFLVEIGKLSVPSQWFILWTKHVEVLSLITAGPVPVLEPLSDTVMMFVSTRMSGHLTWHAVTCSTVGAGQYSVGQFSVMQYSKVQCSSVSKILGSVVELGGRWVQCGEVNKSVGQLITVWGS